MIYSENILLCIAIPLAISLFFLRGGAKRFVITFLTGMGVCLVAAYINGYINSISAHSAEDMAVYVSPVIEEVLKFFPVLFYMYVFLPDERNLLVSSVGIGAGFATFENCCYLLSIGAEKLSFVLIRGLAVGTMHIATLTLLTAMIIIMRRHDAISIPALIAAVSMSAGMHALYNLLVSESGLSSALGYVFPFLTSLLLYYAFRTRVIVRTGTGADTAPRSTGA